jgi:fucose permease
MMPQLSEAFTLSAAGVATLAGIFYYGYSPFSLLAGTAIDRMGAKGVIPAGAVITGIGALLFGVGGLPAANLGRFLQGAGGVFALVGAIYIASTRFPASSSRNIDRRNADVRYGRRIRWAVSGRSADRPRIVVEELLD